MNPCGTDVDWQPVVIALAAAIPTLVVVVRNHFTLADMAAKQDAHSAHPQAAAPPEVPNDPA